MHIANPRYARASSFVGGLALFAIAALASADAGHGAWPKPSDAIGAKAGFSAEGLAALDARMKQAVDQNEVPGVMTLLVHHGKVDHDAHGRSRLRLAGG